MLDFNSLMAKAQEAQQKIKEAQRKVPRQQTNESGNNG